MFTNAGSTAPAPSFAYNPVPHPTSDVSRFPPVIAANKDTFEAYVFYAK